MTSPYGSMPPEQSHTVDRGPEPSTVATAQKLMYLRAAVALIGLLTTFATKSSLKSAILKQNPNYDPAKLDSALNAALGVAIAFGIIFLVLYVLLAIQVGRGRNWARIVTFVLAALGILGALSSLLQTTTGLSKVLTVIEGLIDIAIIVLLAGAPARAYFAGRRA